MAPIVLALANLAPSLFQFLGKGDAAAVAEKAINVAKAVTGTNTPESALDALKSNPDAVFAYQKAVLEQQAEFERLAVRREEIAADDRKSARTMFIETRDITPSALSWIIVGFTLAVEGFILTQGVPETVDPLITGRVLGTLDAALIAVISFWLGSSNSSRSKDETIGRLTR